MPVYSVKNGSNVTVTDNYGNPTVSIVATPIFAGVNVGGALTGATTGSFSGTVTVGGNTGTQYVIVNGGNSGSGSGAAVSVQNAGGTVMALGNKSSILGGAYDGTPYVYTGGSQLVVSGAVAASYFIANSTAGTAQFTFTSLAGGSNQTALFASGSVTAGVTATAFSVYGIGLTIPQLVGVDASGNMGIAGSLKTVSSATVGGALVVNGATATGFVVEVAGVASADGMRISATNGGLYRMDTTSSNAAARNWIILPNHDAMGDFHIRTSNARLGEPTGGTGTARLRIDPTGNAYFSAAVQGTNFVATSTGILLSSSTAAAGTGFYFDSANAAIRTAGAIYFQGASGVGVANIASVGSISGTGNLTMTGSGNHVFGTNGATGTDSTILTLGNNQGGSNYAFITTHDTVSVAGIVGSCLGFGQGGLINAMQLDTSGNLGVAGSYYAVSASVHKTGIREIDFDPVDAIKNTAVRHFNYTHDPADHEERLGLIADQSPTEISPTQDRHDFMRVSAVTIAALQDVIARLEALEASHA